MTCFRLYMKAELPNKSWDATFNYYKNFVFLKNRLIVASFTKQITVGPLSLSSGFEKSVFSCLLLPCANKWWGCLTWNKLILLKRRHQWVTLTDTAFPLTMDRCQVATAVPVSEGGKWNGLVLLRFRIHVVVLFASSFHFRVTVFPWN